MNGERVTIISGIVSLSLLIIKLFVGLLFNNSLILSDALDNAFDLLLMSAAWFGLRLSSRKPDESFPFGYYKAESLVSLLLSVVILFVAGSLIINGFNELINPTIITGNLFLIIVSTLSMISSYFLSVFLKRNGLRLRSQLLLTSSRERLSDALKSLIILSSFIIALFGVNLTGLLTIIISIIVFRVGLSSIREAVLALMDAAPRNLENKVLSIIKSVKGVMGVSDLRLRSAGSFVFGEVKISVSKNLSVSKAHLIASNVEEAVKGLVESIIVHVEPAKFSSGLIAIPVNNNRGLKSIPATNFARARGFIIVKVVNGVIKSYSYRINPFINSRVRAGLSVAKFIIGLGVNVLITREIGEIALHTLRDDLVDVFIAKRVSVESLINLLINGELSVFKKPSKVK